MGFEYVYAYVENLQWVSAIGLIVSAVVLLCLIGMRINNDIDVDDWQVLMYWAVPSFMVFLFMSCAPGMEHIQKVRTTAITPYVEKTETKPPEETDAKPIYYPSNYCVNSLMCNGAYPNKVSF